MHSDLGAFLEGAFAGLQVPPCKLVVALDKVWRSEKFAFDFVALGRKLRCDCTLKGGKAMPELRAILALAVDEE